jgi:DNA recombination protein RmuC
MLLIIGLATTTILLIITLILLAISLSKAGQLATEFKILRAENAAFSQSQLQSQKNSLEAMAQSIDSMNKNLDVKLFNMQQDNNAKFEKIRATVEEKLHETLEKRLGDSFKIVSDRLELVHKGLGEMQTLATGVGDLKKVLANVKTRGIWGEVQLEALIEQIMIPSQYEKNVAIKPGSAERVEIAIKIPTKSDEKTFIYLPIDAKFPLDCYQRIVEAQEVGDIDSLKQEIKLLEIFIKNQAKSIAEKYLVFEYTTDFAIMFLPIEGLYAEVLRIPGLLEILQRDYRIVITSPTTLAAILNSLQLGFKTIAIERRSHDVWKILGTVKHEFIKFADTIAKTRIKLDQASKIIGDVEHRSKILQKKLKNVEETEGETISFASAPSPLTNQADITDEAA